MAKIVNEIQALRAEARFALMCGAILLALGVVLAGFFAALAWPAESAVSPVLGLYVAGPPVLAGWGVCVYASVRLERARKLEAGESVARPLLAMTRLSGISRAMTGFVQKLRQGWRQAR
ncbi:MAG: hypothetical protein AB7J28_02675 [Hyphomonadaceae bacterium]